MNHDIFISYSSKQKSIADGVCHYLEENGFKCWMAPRDISVGSEYGDLIEEAIKTSKVVVLVFSQAASISKWVKGEINVAFTEDKPILPFRIDDTEIKGSFRVMLNQMHWIDAFPKYADQLPDLLNSVCGFLGRYPQKVSNVNERLDADHKTKEAAERERLERERKQKIMSLKPNDEHVRPKEKSFFQKAWPWGVAFLVFEIMYAIIIHRANNDGYWGKLGDGVAYGIVVSWPFILLFAVCLWLIKRYSLKFKLLPWVIAGMSVVFYILCIYLKIERYSSSYLFYVLLLMALMSLAALFVYRPEKFKVLPWIVLAIMELTFFIESIINYLGYALLYGDKYHGAMTITSNPGFVIHRFFWIGKANLSFGDSFFLVTAIPIFALWIMLIIESVQKKKKHYFQ